MATTPTTPDVWAFLREIIARLGAKNPKFFNVMAWIGAIATFITGIPALIATIPGIAIPPDVLILQSKVVAWAGIVVFIMSNLAVQRDAVVTTGSGKPVVLPGSEAALPFTEKKEAEKVADAQKTV